MDDVIEILLDLKDRVERQIRQHENGGLTVSEVNLDLRAANRKFSHMLNSQLIDINEAIELTSAAAARNALSPS
ncbi:MAG: hypothetical protein M3O26_16820 [Pseudomonadota bacterium]|nr:hypothetical protein [Pseudomonadota bacterium]